MKRTVTIVSVLVLMASMTAVASGSRERDESAAPEWDSVTVTGQLDIRDGYFPSLQADGQTWELMVHAVPDEVEVENGQTITVSGFEMPHHRWESNTESRALMVETATINGKEYILPVGPAAMMGGYGGMMGGRGARHGGMMGSWDNGNRASSSAGYGCGGSQASYRGNANQRSWR